MNTNNPCTVDQQRQWSLVLKKAVILTLWSVPPICAFYFMSTHWVPLPYWDEWDTPGKQLASYYRGTLSLAELFSQQNESRPLFPRLLYLTISTASGWDVRHYMALTFAWACAGSAGIYQIVQRTSPFSRATPFLFGAMNFLLFSPRQYENFLFGMTGQSLTPAVALTFAILMNLTERSLKSKTLVNAALAFLSTYTFSGGMLVWLLAFPLEAAGGLRAGHTRADRFWRALYIFAAAASIVCYFISYRHPPLAPPLISPIAQLPAFVRFVLVWIGSLFSVSAPEVCGAVVLLLFGCLATVAIAQMRRTGEWRSRYPWLILGSYTIISGCVAAVGRLGFDYSAAGHVRYAVFSAFLYIAVLGLGFSVYRTVNARMFTARIGSLVAIVFLLVILTFWATTFKKERHFLRIFTAIRKHSLLVLRWSEAIPQNPEIALLSPYPLEETIGTIHTLADHDVLRPRLVSQKLARAVNERPNPNAATAGSLQTARLEPTGHLVFQGSARLVDQDRPADCVVLGFETSDEVWKPFCVVETGRWSDARHFASGTLERAGFSGLVDGSTLPNDELTIRAWAIDLQGERAFPMVGTLRLRATR